MKVSGSHRTGTATFWAALTLAPTKEDDMSSDIHQPIDSFDPSIMRTARRYAGFGSEKPLGELGCGAARRQTRVEVMRP